MEDDRNVMEAVEALASLARHSTVHGGGPGSPCMKESTAVISSPRSSQDRAIADFHGNAVSTVTSASNTGESGKIIPSKMTSYQLRSARKSRRNLTEAEKEARRLHRVLANRESARQTIRRRQAMYQELTRKAADLVEQNENLKKEKELVMKEYNSLKGRNEFFKLQMANVKKDEPQEQQKSTQSETATSALHNHPSLAPFFWPLVPSSNIIQLQYPSHADVMTTTSQVSTHPFIVLPVPWSLPLFDYTRMLHSHSDTDNRQTEAPSANLCSVSSSSDTSLNEDKHDLSSNVVPEEVQCIRPTNSEGEKISTSATEPQCLPKKNAENRVCENPQKLFAAIKARRRRKELMRLKNIHYLHAHTHRAYC